MDFFKKSCKELCTRLWKDISDTQKRITTTDELDKFVLDKCAEYDKESKTNPKSKVITKEKEYLNGIYEALEKEDIVTKLTELHQALEKLGSRTHVKLFSIFFGIGTGTYYREAAKKIKKELKIHVASKGELENLKKELEKITEEKKKQESKEKDRKRQDKLKNLIENKDLFRGLPNGGNYCYLNTAIQNLYYDKSFSDKILKTPIPENKKPECKELYAVKVFFLYLAGKLTLNHFNSLRTGLAKDLGYDGSQANSLAMQQKLELTCKNQMRLLKQKTPIFDSERYTPDDENFDLNKTIDGWADIPEPDSPEDKAGRVENILNSVKILLKLYEDVSLRQRVLGLDKQDININEYDKLLTIIDIFNLIANKKFNSQQTNLVEKLGNDQTFSGIKKYINETIDAMDRSKKSRLLTKDSSIDIQPSNNIFDSIKGFVTRKVAENKAYHLPLKKNCFTVTFGDRIDGYRTNFTVEEDLDLESLVTSKRLKIFQKNEEIKKYKFKLISATIGTGGHYYIYRKIGNQWKKFNDSSVSDCTWEKIQGDICERCELLMYELV